MWAHHAHRVWPDEAHRPAPPQDFALQRRSRFTYFPEAGRDNHGPFHARLGALADDVRHGCGRSRHQDQVHFLRNVGDAGICRNSEHAGPFRIHWEHREGAAGEIRDQRTPDAARLLRRPDDSHIARLKEHIEHKLIRS